VVRLLVVSSPPSFIPGGDGGQYVALARELISARFIVPSINTIYYPGTQWVLPPLPVLLLAFLMSVFGSVGWAPFQILLALSITFDVATLIPLWQLSNSIFGEPTAYVIAAAYIAYPPALYTLTWAGYAPIIGVMLSVWCLLYSVKLVTTGHSALRNAAILGLLLGLTALSHDLSAFVLLGGIILLLVALALSRLRVSWRSTVHSPNALWHVLLSLLIASPAYLYWYAGRLDWLASAAGNQMSGGSNAIGVFEEYLTALRQPFGPLFEVEIVVLFPFLIYGIYLMARRYPSSAIAVLPFMLSPSLLALWKWNDPSLFIFLYYYIVLFSVPPIAFALISVVGSASSRTVRTAVYNFRRRRGVVVRAIGYGAIFLLIAVNSVTSVNFNTGSHTWFNECFDCSSSGPRLYDYSVLYWITGNVNRDSVIVAPGNLSNWGFYVCGYTGNPCIVAHGLQWLSQASERAESTAAQVLIYTPSENLTLTSYYIHKYDVSYVMTYTEQKIDVPKFYTEVYNDSFVKLYNVNQLASAG
jgi:hypothetical protein